MKIINIIVLLSLSISIYAQTEIKFALFGGGDYSMLKAPADSISVSSNINALAGAELIYLLKNNNQLHLGSSIFTKSSTNVKHIKYNNTFVSLNANYYWGFSKNVYFTVGPQYSVIIKSNTRHGSEIEDLDGYNSYLSVNAGINLRLQSHLNLGVAYEYPINNPKLAAWPSLKVSISLLIDKGLFKVSEKDNRKVYAQKNIQTLKKTALLVRLRGYKKQIAAYQEKGDTVMVNLMKKKRDEQNQSIVDAFASEFSFCPVYFFYNYDTKKIRNKEYTNVFVNKDLRIDPAIEFNLDTFLIGELGYTTIDTTSIFGHNGIARDSDNQLTDRAVYSKSNDFSNYGFSIRNQDFYVIPHPFPSFISGYFTVIKRSNKSMVSILNERLLDYYRGKKK